MLSPCHKLNHNERTIITPYKALPLLFTFPCPDTIPKPLVVTVLLCEIKDALFARNF